MTKRKITSPLAKKLWLTNFQGFLGSRELDLSNLNLIFGPNASGKSSIIRALKLLKQSLKNGEFGGFVFDGNLVNLGSRELCVYSNRTKLALGIGLGFDTTSEFSQVCTISGLGLEIQDSDGAVHFDVKVRIQGMDSFVTAIELLYLEDDDEGISHEQTRLTEDGLDLIGSLIETALPKAPARFAQALAPKFLAHILTELDFEFDLWVDFEGNEWEKEEVPGYEFEVWRNSSSGAFLPHELERQFEIVSQNPLRSVASQDPLVQAFASCQLQTLNQMILSSLELTPKLSDYENGVIDPLLGDKSDLGPGSPPRLIEEIVETIWLDALSSVASWCHETHFSNFSATQTHLVPQGPKESGIEVQSISTETQKAFKELTDERYSLKLESHVIGPKRWSLLYIYDDYTRTAVDLSNVGEGLSHLANVLTELIQNRSASIHQPETHLHPKMQSELADLFIAISRERQLFIETHSESLLLRVQRRIREGSLSDHAVKIIYCDGFDPPVTDRVLNEYLASGKLSEPQKFIVDHLLQNLPEDKHERIGARSLEAFLGGEPFAPKGEVGLADLKSQDAYNVCRNLRLDHAGHVLDPFPPSFADLRIQDLL